MPPLDGIRVLDLSRVLAGPYCTMLLADLGADVIKVERPGEGDETRSWGPPFAGGESAYFLAVNRGKRSVALDLARPEAQEALRRLAGRADVVIENFRTGTAERLGAGYEQLARENPKLVYCSISGFGDDRPGYDFVLQAESGLMAITGAADGAPSKVGVAVVDVLAGYAAATAILGALVGGGGKQVEISLYDVALSALVNAAQGALVTGKEPRATATRTRASSRTRRSAPPTGSSRSPLPTTGSSGACATRSSGPNSPRTSASPRTRRASGTAPG